MNINDALKKIKKHSSLDIPTKKQTINSSSMRPYEHQPNQQANNKGAIGEQQGNNWGATREQSGSKINIIREQQGSNKGAIGEQSGSKKVIKKNVAIEAGHTHLALKNNKGISHTLNENENDLIRLSSQQKKIMFFILNKIINTKQLRTIPILHGDLSNFCNTTYATIKVQIKRLIKKELLIRGNGKRGKGGYMIFEIRSNIYSNLLDLKKQETIFHSFNKGTNLPLSSSNYNTTTTKLPDEWLNINFEGLKDYGFIDKHIQQMAKIDDLSPDDAQESINHFVFDLLENNKESEIKKTPVAFFMGTLNNKGFYMAPKNFESLRDRALRLKTEQAKQQQEKREKMEEDLIGVEFNNWHVSLADIEIDKLIPERIKNTKVAKDAQIRSFLKDYFKDKCWPAIQQEKYADCFEFNEAV